MKEKCDLNFKPKSYWSLAKKAEMPSRYLPPYLSEEVEIARVTVKTVMGNIISIRARKETDGNIHYRVVDEYYDDPGREGYKCNVEMTEEPLTLGELISIMDNVESEDYLCETWHGVTEVHREREWDLISDDADPASLIDYVNVTSEFYPQIQEYYEEEAKTWVENKLQSSFDGIEEKRDDANLFCEKALAGQIDGGFRKWVSSLLNQFLYVVKKMCTAFIGG